MKLANELRYRRILTRGFRRHIAYINDIYFPAILAVSVRYRRDIDETEDLARAFESIAEEMVNDVNDLHQVQADEHTVQWINNVRSTLGIDIAGIISASELGPSLELFAEQTATLIKGVSSDLSKNISRITYEALQQGMGQDALARELALRFNEELHGKHVGRTEASRAANMARKRAAVRRMTDPTTGTGLPYRYQSRYELIARDQTAKLYAYLDRLRQEQAGIEKYRWATSRDERVRQQHRDYHNRIFSWDNPPSDGHPGQPVNCRCLAMAVIE